MGWVSNFWIKIAGIDRSLRVLSIPAIFVARKKDFKIKLFFLKLKNFIGRAESEEHFAKKIIIFENYFFPENSSDSERTRSQLSKSEGITKF